MHLPWFLSGTGVREFSYKTVLYILNSEGKFMFCVFIFLKWNTLSSFLSSKCLTFSHERTQVIFG